MSFNEEALNTFESIRRIKAGLDIEDLTLICVENEAGLNRLNSLRKYLEDAGHYGSKSVVRMIKLTEENEILKKENEELRNENDNLKNNHSGL